MVFRTSTIGWLLVALLYVLFGPSAHALQSAAGSTTTEAVGTSPHEISVSSRGAARISIPLRAPLVDGGIALPLSLEYDAARGGDQGRYGLDDVSTYGWYLNGLSAIHRCSVGESAPAAAIKGQSATTSGDGLCLDGERLILIAGAPATATAEYRPERDPDTRVRARRGADGELWFEVGTGDGSVRAYGVTAGARVRGPVRSNWGQGQVTAGPVLVWGLERVALVNATEVRVAWQGGADGRLFAPRRITQGEYDIVLHYSRPLEAGKDNARQGAPRALLESVAFAAGSRPVRTYRLEHRRDDAGRERLVSLQECGFDREGQQRSCLPPLRFSWTGIEADAPHYPVVLEQLADGLGAVNRFGWWGSNEHGSDDAGDMPTDLASSPYGALTPIPDVRLTRGPLVREHTLEPGTALERRWRYDYRARALTSTRGRGYLGVPETRVTDSGRGTTTYIQFRLDWPFAGSMAQRRVYMGAPGDSRQEIEREEHRFETEEGQGAVRRPFVATQARWQLEGGRLVGVDLLHQFPCRARLDEPVCQEQGAADNVWLSIAESGVQLADGVAATAIWGDVPRRRIAAGALRERRTERLVREHVVDPWVRGRVVARSVTWEAPGAPSRTQSEAYTHRPGTREVARFVQFPGDPELERVIEREFAVNDPQPLSETLRGAGAEPRRWQRVSQGDAMGEGETLINPLGQLTERWHDPRFGTLWRASEDGSRDHRFERDPFGRLVREIRPDQVTIEYDYVSCRVTDCLMPGDGRAAFSVTQREHVAGVKRGPHQIRIYDRLGRLLLQSRETLGSPGIRSHERYSYDAAGRVVGVTRALSDSAPPACRGPGSGCEWREFDARDRMVRESYPDGGQVRLTYGANEGLRTVVRTETLMAAGESNGMRQQHMALDLAGRLRESRTENGADAAAVSRYRYDAAGNLASVEVNGTRVATVGWDRAGSRVRLDDASAGTTLWQRNGLGEVVGVIESGGRTTRFERDALGRVIARHRQDGASDRWQWDPDDARGALAARSAPGFNEIYRHDADGRLVNVETELAAPGQIAGTYQRSLAYDTAGRLVGQRFPNGVELAYRHSETGLVDAVEMNGSILHAWHTLDAAGRPTRESLQGGALWSSRSYHHAGGPLTRIESRSAANDRVLQDHSYLWQSNGQLAQRLNGMGTASATDDRSERLRYDSQNRLVSLSESLRALSLSYDRAGNLVTLRSARATAGSADEFRFPDPAAPFQLQSARLDGVALAYRYDSSGRVVRRAGADGVTTTVLHDALGRVSEITLGTEGALPRAQDAFQYDPDGRRLVTRESWRNGDTSARRLTLELGGDFERVELATAGRYDRVERISATPALRIVRRRVAETGQWERVVEYVHRDHLGSVELITDGAGRVLERFAYDPFGARRHPDTGERLQGGALAELLDRQDTSGSQGFTDHRHLDRTGFIHMQGRVFDPRAGRFLSPDPLLQNPADAQSFNRYAYVGYDALSLVDPSGMCGREVGYQLTPCEAGLEQLRVVASRLPGAGLPFAFGSLSYAGAAPWMSLPGGLPTVGGLGLPNLSGIVPQVLTQLNAAGLRSAGAAVCLGSVLGGCGALSVDTRSGAVYGMLLLGVVPGAGLSIGAERVLWQSPTQQAGGFGTALFVSGGVAGLGGSLALAQGTNGVNLTGTVGYGFGFGGGAGFYYALPLGVLGY